MQTLDFVERQAPGVAAVMCAKCRAVKPEKSFERKLTPLQAKARGHTGAFAVAYISSICHDCKPVRRKPLHELTRKELGNLHSSGKLRTYQYEDELERRKLAKSKAGREAVMRRWSVKYDFMWAPLMENLREEIMGVLHQQRYANAKGVPDGGFFGDYLRQLKLLRMELKQRRSVAVKPPLFATWEAHFNDKTWFELGLRWRELLSQLVKTAHGDWVMRTREPMIVRVRYSERPDGAPKRRKEVPVHERTEHMIHVDTSAFKKPLVNLSRVAVTDTEKESRSRLSQIK